MRWTITVLRRTSAADTPYWQSFYFESEDERATVATALTALSETEDLRDTENVPATSPEWESSCLQRRCGACAMVICGLPALACDTRLTDLGKDVVTLEPLRKFPVVRDLVVDRTGAREALAASGTWLAGDAELADRRWEFAVEGGRCLQCGLCLEACPTWCADGPFGGMAQMAPLARLIACAPREERRRLAAAHRTHVFAGCAKALACRDVCPAKLDIDAMLSRSNAAALWRRW